MIITKTAKPPLTKEPLDNVKERFYVDEPRHVHVLFSKTSWPVSVVWALLSFVVASTSVVSLVQPEWLVREHTDVLRPFLTYDPDSLIYMLGLYCVCYKDTDLLASGSAFCYSFDGAAPSDSDNGKFPSTAWQLSFLLFGSGTVLFTTSSLFAILSLGLFGYTKRKFAAHVIGHVQGAAVILQMLALFLFPWVLGSPFAEAHCGPGTQPFRPGHCRLGWASMLALISTLLGVYCPLLVRFTSYRVYAGCPWNVL